MASRNWTRDELLLAMNLYCQLPFGKLHQRNPQVIQLAAATDRTPSSVAMKLVNLASLDPIQQQRGIKGLSGASAADRQIWQEFHENWDELSVESETLRDRIENPAPASNNPPNDIEETITFTGETETTRTIKVRLAQRFFRRSVLASYNSRCCITSIPIPSLLIASHILPWSTFPTHRANPRNGLCLSRLHDAAFDNGLITFDDEYRLVLSKELQSATTNEVLRDSFQKFEGTQLQLPEKFRPESSFLTIHQTKIFRN